MPVSLRSSRHIDLGDGPPWQVNQGAQVGGAVFFSLLGLMFCSMPLLALRILEDTGTDQPGTAELLVVALFTGLGALLLVLALRLFRRRIQLEVTTHGVRGSVRGAFRTEHWQEPLSAYRGVLAYRQRSGKRNGHSPLLAVVQLEHREQRRRDLLLWRSPDTDAQRSRAEAFARALGLPVLEGAPGGPYKDQRGPADLDRSAGERARRGQVPLSAPQGMPPAGLRAEQIGGHWRLSCNHRRPAHVMFAAVFLLGGLLLAAYQQDAFGPNDAPWLVLLVAIGFTVFGLHTARDVLLGRSWLETVDGGVKIWTTRGGTILHEQVLAGTAIEAVDVAREDASWEALVLRTDAGNTSWGGLGLDAAGLAWARGVVLSHLATSASPGNA